MRHFLRQNMDNLEELRESLKESFSKVKKDIATHDSEIKEIKDLISDLNKKIDYLIENAKERTSLSNFPHETKGSQKLVSVRQIRDSNLESEFLKKFKKNRKNIIKSKILSLIKNKEMGRIELKSVIVDQLNYCSKASLYRYLQEMMYQGQINSVNSKEKEYFIVSKS